jgi:hypothetical protein
LNARRRARCRAHPLAKVSVLGAYHQRVFAWIHIRLGHQWEALDILEPLLALPGGLSAGELRLNAYFDPLRGKPRFQRMLARAK